MSQATPAALIRQWARNSGIAVGERGRLSPGVLAAYAAAHPLAGDEAPPRPPAERTARIGFRIVANPVPGGRLAGRRVRASSR